MCGIIGIVGCEPVNHKLYDGLTLLQHRGQDAAGIATCEDRKLYVRKAPGLVKEVFRATHMFRLRGNMGICLLYTSPSPRDRQKSRMPSSA